LHVNGDAHTVEPVYPIPPHWPNSETVPPPVGPLGGAVETEELEGPEGDDDPSLTVMEELPELSKPSVARIM